MKYFHRVIKAFISNITYTLCDYYDSYTLKVHYYITDFDLGKLQNGKPINDVILPKWANSPEDFTKKHMEALVITSQ